MKLIGGKDFTKVLKNIEKGTPRKLADALLDEAQTVFEASQVLVPVDTGLLKSTGQVHDPEVTAGGNVEVEISYGSDATPYAVFVHERLDVHHDAPTQAKFLEQPFEIAKSNLDRRLAEKMKRQS